MKAKIILETLQTIKIALINNDSKQDDCYITEEEFPFEPTPIPVDNYVNNTVLNKRYVDPFADSGSANGLIAKLSKRKSKSGMLTPLSLKRRNTI
jgi:hypothetical protein